MIEFFVLFLDSLPTVNVLRTPGKSIYLSMPPSAHSVKKLHQHFFSDQRSKSVSQLLFCCDWRRETSFAHGFCHLSLCCAPAGLMTHSPAGRLLATAWVSRFTARANASGLMKYASAEAGWLDKKKSQQYCGWGAPKSKALNIKEEERLKQSRDVWRSRSLPRELGMTGFQMKTHHLQQLHLHAARG